MIWFLVFVVLFFINPFLCAGVLLIVLAVQFGRTAVDLGIQLIESIGYLLGRLIGWVRNRLSAAKKVEP